MNRQPRQPTFTSADSARQGPSLSPGLVIHEDRSRPHWLTRMEPLLATDGFSSAVPDGARRAAVLVTLVEGAKGPQVLLTRRSGGLRYLPGTISIPGGASEATDHGPVGTALRETEAETGLDHATVDVIGQLSDRATAEGGFLVTPVVAWTRHLGFTAAPNPDEVDQIGLVLLSDLGPLLNSPRPGLLHFYAGKPELSAGTLTGAVGPMTADVLAEIVTICRL